MCPCSPVLPHLTPMPLSCVATRQNVFRSVRFFRVSSLNILFQSLRFRPLLLPRGRLCESECSLGEMKLGLSEIKEGNECGWLHSFLSASSIAGPLSGGLFGSFRVVADREMTSLSSLSSHKPRPCRRPQRSNTKREQGSALPHTPSLNSTK